MPNIPVSNKGESQPSGPQKRIRPVADIISPRTPSSAADKRGPMLRNASAKSEKPEAPKEQKSAPRVSPLPPRETKEIERLDRSVAEFFSKRPATDATKPEKEAEPKEDGFPVHSWSPERPRVSKKFWLWGGGSLGALAAVVLLLSTIFARVLINVRPLVETVTLPPVALKVYSSAPAIDASQGIIPGEYVEFSESRQFEAEATGKQFVNSKARGSISITNAYSSQPQVLVANTRFVTIDGKVFRLEKAVTVPGAKVENGNIIPTQISATVVAAEAGDKYNIGPSDFTIPGFQGTPKYKTFTAKSSQAFSGGLVGEAIVTTDADIKKAVESATASMFEALRESLKTKVPPEFQIIDGAREIAITDVDAPPVKFPGSKFQVKVTGSASAIAFRAADEGDLIAALFSTTTSRA